MPACSGSHMEQRVLVYLTGTAIVLLTRLIHRLRHEKVCSHNAMHVPMQIARARQEGQRVIGEAVAAGLTLDESMMWNPNFTVAAQHVMSPPLRKERDRVAVRNALAGGVLSIVGTDHAVFNSTQKAQGKRDFRTIPNGVNGIEERMAVVWNTMVRPWPRCSVTCLLAHVVHTKCTPVLLCALLAASTGALHTCTDQTMSLAQLGAYQLTFLDMVARFVAVIWHAQRQC